MFINNPFNGAFGLDIGDLSLKLVQLERCRRWGERTCYRVKELRSASLPPGYIVNGEILQPEMVRKKLLFLLGKEGRLKPIKSPWVVADLPEPKTFLKLIEINSPPDELTSDDVLYQAKYHLPFSLDEAYLDWQLVGEHKSRSPKSKVLLAASTKISADSYTYLLESVDLQVVALEIEAVALARALITEGKAYQNEARLLLDLGATRSSLVVYDYQSLQFSACLDFSGELITTALAQELKIEHEQAEELKKQVGLNHSKQYPKYLPAAARLVEHLIADIKKHLTFYKEHFPNANPITHITMSGGVSNWDNLNSTLARRLKISAAPGNVWKNLNYNPKPGEREQGASAASALGLALRATRDPYQE